MIYRDGAPISARQLKRASSTHIEFFPFWEPWGIEMVSEYEERAAATTAGIPFPEWRNKTDPGERGAAIAYLRYERLIQASVQEASGERATREANRARAGRGA